LRCARISRICMSSLNVLAFIVSEICALKRIDSANDQEHILYIKINKKQLKSCKVPVMFNVICP